MSRQSAVDRSVSSPVSGPVSGPVSRRSAAPAFIALSVAGTFTSLPAWAETPDGAPAADADARDILVDGVREQIATGPKQVAPLLDTPKSIVVVPREIIEQTGAASLTDALRTVPGITFGAAEGGNPIGDRPFIRGFDSQGSTYLDGVRDFSAQSREVFAVDQIQIVRGSDSTLGGRGSAGGAINIVSKLPVARDFVTTTLSLGTADYKRAVLDANVRLSGTIAVRLEGLYHDQDVAGRAALWQQRWGIAPSITIGLGTPTRLTASYYHLTSHELPDSGIPYLYTAANAPGTGIIYSPPAIGRITTIGGTTGTVDRSAFYGLATRDFRTTQTDQATVRIEHDFGGVTLRNNTRLTRNDQSYIYTQPDDSQGNVYGTNAASPATAGGLVWRRPNTRYGYAESLVNQTDIYGEVTTGAIKHQFSAGLELAWERAVRGTFVSRGLLNANGIEVLAGGALVSPRCGSAAIARYNCTSLFAPNPADPWVNYASDSAAVRAPIVRSLPIEETRNDARTQSLYGFDSITISDKLIVNLGLRYDRFTSIIRPGQTYTATQTVRYARTDNLFNWQAGAVFKPTKSTSLYASYATSATPPNSLLGEGQDLNALPTTGGIANPAFGDSLKVETTKSYEIGAKANMLGGKLALGLALFQTDTDNARTLGPDNLPQFLGKRRIRGIELSANGTILPGWNVFGGYTHLDPKIIEAGFTALTVAANGAQPARTALVPSIANGRQATQTARDSFTIWTDLAATKRLSLSGGAFYTSRVFGGYADNRTAAQDASGTVTVSPATKILYRTIPGYWRLDARIAYQLTKRLNLSVNIQNLTNATYFTQAYTNHYATIAPGRSAFATLSARF